MNHIKKEIILASSSPRRHELLTAAGYRHTVAVSDVDETLDAGVSAAEGAKELSRRKALCLLSKIKEDGGKKVIIGADTVVEFENEIFGKPKDAADARRMLCAMSGKRHFVHTGITVTDGIYTVSETVSAAVKMRPLSDAEIDGYIATGEPMDKAGAYGIQGAAGAFVESVEGDFFSIVGLPLCRLSEILAEFNIGMFE